MGRSEGAKGGRWSLIHHGDCLAVLQTLPEASVQCCVTSPPYWNLRDYGVPGQIGLEETVGEYVEKLAAVFLEVRRVLKPDGVLWLNLGDSYAGSWGAQGRQGKTGELAGRSACAERQIAAAAKRKSGAGSISRADGLKPKDLCGIPWRVAFALQDSGWWLRSDVIWCKGNPMPESVKDRPTKAHEYVFLMTKSEQYFYDLKAVKEAGSPESHARYARGRSADLKWADGGPKNQTIAKGFDHMRTPGVNPKSTKAGFKTKQNESFSAAVKDIVEFRNLRSWWRINTEPTPEAHFATFPIRLAERCILAGSKPGDTIFDPFAGAGTTWLACLKHRARIRRHRTEPGIHPHRGRKGEKALLAPGERLTRKHLVVEAVKLSAEFSAALAPASREVKMHVIVFVTGEVMVVQVDSGLLPLE